MIFTVCGLKVMVGNYYYCSIVRAPRFCSEHKPWKSDSLGVQSLVAVQLRCLLIHDLLSQCNCALRRSRGSFFGVIIRVVVNEQVFDTASAYRPLIDRVARRKLPVLTNLYGIQQPQCEYLAVVVDEVVRRPLCSHGKNGHVT